MAIKTPAELKALILAAFTDNDTGDILPIAARGFLDDAVDSLVPAHGGSAALDRLQWNATTGVFSPVSAVDTQYLVVHQKRRLRDASAGARRPADPGRQRGRAAEHPYVPDLSVFPSRPSGA